MAHKPLVGGTAYEIKGGKTLIDGTAYSIKSGKTLVGGTAYEVGFAIEGAALTITTSGMFLSGSVPASVTINGVSYNSPTEIIVPYGTVIICSAPWVTMYNSSNRAGGSVKLNGSEVAPLVVGVNPTIYEYTVNKDVTIDFGYVNVPTGAGYTNTRTGTTINITEL